MTTIERLRALEKAVELVAKATPGSWAQEHRRGSDSSYRTEVFDEHGGAIATLTWHAKPPSYENGLKTTSTDRAENAEAIVAAVNFIREHGSALIAELGQEVGAVPSFRGYANLGVGAYLLEHSAEGEDAELCIVPATEAEKAGRTVGDLRHFEGERDPIPAERMAVRIRFDNVAGLDALEQQLRLLREVHFPASPAHTSGARDAVSAELERAVRKFPTWPTDPLHAVAVLGEEFGELTKAVLQSVYEPQKVKPGEVRTEAVQTAAMALRFLQSLDAYVYAGCEQHSQDAAMCQEAE